MKLVYGTGANAAVTEQIVLRVGSFNGAVSVAVALAAASLVAGASTTTYAASANPERMDSAASRAVPIAREEDTAFSVVDALAEIKRKAGLTWDNLARMFGVSRRAVHNWVNGESLTPAHQELVATLLERVRSAKGLRPFQMRKVLLSEASIGEAMQPAVAIEPPILVADPTPFRHNLEVRRDRKTKLVRRPSERVG